MPATPVETARGLAAVGRGDEAATLLDAALAGGDAVAGAELAAWRLRGDVVPRIPAGEGAIGGKP